MKIKNMIKTNIMREYRKGFFVMMASLLLALPFPANGGSSLTGPASVSSAGVAAFDFGPGTLASQLLGVPFMRNRELSFATSTSPTLAAAAGSGFVYIIGSSSGGDSFGDEPGSVGGNYRGLQFTYTFNLPGVNPTQAAQVILSSKSVSVSCNRFEINGVQIDTVLRDHNDSTVWETEQGRILPSVQLRETGNTLRIAALNDSCTTGGNEDDFVVANVVIHYIQ